MPFLMYTLEEEEQQQTKTKQKSLSFTYTLYINASNKTLLTLKLVHTWYEESTSS